MSLELCAFRLYAPYFGYSVYVWGTMISVVMIALAVGYALGGWLADRSQSDKHLYFVIVGSGLYQFLIICVMRSVLRWLWQSGEVLGTVVASLIIFLPTMAALATAAPFAIRLLARSQQVGITAGKVYAFSTAGSVVGVLATTFYFIPHLGTRMTMQVLCTATLVVGAFGFVPRTAPAIAILLAATGALLVPKPELPGTVVWATESTYNWIAVLQHKDLRWLVLNHPAYSQTTRRIGARWSGFYTDYFALGPSLVQSQRMLVLGLGAGGGIVSTLAVVPALRVEAVEIDPKVVEAATMYFDLPKDRSQLSVHVADARPWLAAQSQEFELVQLDLYQGGPYIPFYLITEEFFGEIHHRMSPDALLMMNVYDTSQSRELLFASVATLRRVFSVVLVISRADGNHIVLAFTGQRTLHEVQQRLTNLKGDASYRALGQEAAQSLRDLVLPMGTPVFTDDVAPVEPMTHRMLLAHR